MMDFLIIFIQAAFFILSHLGEKILYLNPFIFGWLFFQD